MIKQFSFAAALLVAPLAHAGSISIQVVTAGGTSTKTVTVSDANIGRMIAAYKTLYPQTCDTADPPVCHASSNAEVFQAFAQGILDGIKANVLAQEKAAAATTAAGAVTPVTMQ